MAKGNLFLSQGRGKVGSVVFSVIKGQQIERVYNPKPANPRSYAQQAQRALLANATKFYKRATQNFYKFAFEDKTVRESDFNAFVKNNIARGAFLTKDQYDSVNWPALGRFTMTKGSLPVQLDYGWMGDFFGINTMSGSTTTVGALSAWFQSKYPSIQTGDIVTFVRAWSALDLDFGTPNEAPQWDIVQFKIDATDTRTLVSLGLSVDDDAGGSGNVLVGFEVDGTTTISMGSVCISRVTSSGLRVTDSQLVLSPMGQPAADWLSSVYQQRQAAISWGGNPEAVLAGGQLPILPDITGINFANTSAAPWQRRDLVFTGQAGISVAIAGNNLKTTSAGGKLVIKYYGADILADNSAHLLSPTKVTELTATGSVTNLTSTITTAVYQFPVGEDTYSSARGFYSLEYNGVVIAYGTIVADV